MALSVFISVDMEGIAGITTLRQTFRGTDDYAWAREIMTEEANAAVAGAFDAAARSVVVTDSHGDMGNLLPHKLDPRADLVQGTPNVPARAAFRWVSFQVSPFTRTSVKKPVYVWSRTASGVPAPAW